MRDPRLMTIEERAAGIEELTVEAQHRMRDAPIEDAVPVRPVRLPSAGGGPDGGLEVPGPRYTAPAPPPAELGFDLAKWNRMSRAERRAVLRYARKQRGA